MLEIVRKRMQIMHKPETFRDYARSLCKLCANYASHFTPLGSCIAFLIYRVQNLLYYFKLSSLMQKNTQPHELKCLKLGLNIQVRTADNVIYFARCLVVIYPM